MQAAFLFDHIRCCAQDERSVFGKMGGSKPAAFQLAQLHPIQYFRHLVQLLVCVLVNGKLLGLSATGVIVPFLWDPSAPYSTVLGAYSALEYTISHGVFPLLVLGILLMTGCTVGRLFCGWACPFGMLQDFLSYLPFKQQPLSPASVAQLKDIKLAFLGFSILTTALVGFRRLSSPDELYPILYFSDCPFSVLSPSGTVFAFTPWILLWKSNIFAFGGVAIWMKIAILVVAVVPSLYTPRFFCRFMCPLGAILEIFTPYKLLRIVRSPKYDKDECNKMLSEVCPMGVTASRSKVIDHPACIHCGTCVAHEPTKLSQAVG